MLLDMNHPWWSFPENCIYRLPDPPTTTRRTKPVEAICVGISCSGTESLQHTLIVLGYDHTYHGWDGMFESPLPLKACVCLCREKWLGSEDGDVVNTAAEFDEGMGQCMAVIDAPEYCFAAELIAAYPDAKAILIGRDLEAWHRSAVKNLVMDVNQNLFIVIMCQFSAGPWWVWHTYQHFMLNRLFRCSDDGLETGISRNAKWI